MTQTKWYESPEVDRGVIISSRIRLARNLRKYAFPTRLSPTGAVAMIDEMKNAVKNERTVIADAFDFADLTDAPEAMLNELLERHAISREMIQRKGPKALLSNERDAVYILLNEEDHARIQTVFPGENIEKAFDMADKIDNLIEESVEYAFEGAFGYLTSCPTNTGTGMRASYMLHVPALEMSGQLKNVAQAIAKFGMAVRGIHGEGSESMGGIVQVSNQLTLGKSESEILAGLKNVTQQIIDRELHFRNRWLADNKDDLLDRCYRAYGILTNCRKISAAEALRLLSDIRLGYVSEVFDKPRPSKTIYHIMMEVQPWSIQRLMGRAQNEAERDILRARYLNGMFSDSTQWENTIDNNEIGE